MTTKTPFALFTSDTGRTWAVRVLPVGARYGRNSTLTIDDAPTVEFYDTTYADDGWPVDGHGPLGQFVSRYRVETILGTDQYSSSGGQGGLNLDSDAEVWSIDAVTMTRVREWLAVEYAKLVPRIVLRPGHGYGKDMWFSSDTELVMTCRYVPRPANFTIMWVGLDGEARREHGGPVLPGPYGALIAEATVLSAHPIARPKTVTVTAGTELDLVLVGDDSETVLTAPVTRVRVTDDKRYDYPKLVAVEAVTSHGQDS